MPEAPGFKFKMSNVQAALGCAQIQRIDELVCRKRAILANYISEFESQGISYQGFNYESKKFYIGAWMPTVVLDEPSSSSACLFNYKVV